MGCSSFEVGLGWVAMIVALCAHAGACPDRGRTRCISLRMSQERLLIHVAADVAQRRR